MVVKQICNIAVCPGRILDQTVLGGIENGTFTVRSAYHMARVGSPRACSSSQTSHEVWKIIWNALGTKALQFFLWKAYPNFLPTRKNLLWHCVSSNPNCPICGLHEEMVGHALWTTNRPRMCGFKVQKCYKSV